MEKIAIYPVCMLWMCLITQYCSDSHVNNFSIILDCAYHDCPRELILVPIGWVMFAWLLNFYSCMMQSVRDNVMCMHDIMATIISFLNTISFMQK